MREQSWGLKMWQTKRKGNTESINSEILSCLMSVFLGKQALMFLQLQGERRNLRVDTSSIIPADYITLHHYYCRRC